MPIKVILRGGGDLASGAAIRMCRAGVRVVISELAQPFAVRRTVSFAQVVFDGEMQVEGIRALLVNDIAGVFAAWKEEAIPVWVDPTLMQVSLLETDVIVDGRMMKSAVEYSLQETPKVIGLGPGFTCGENCHAAVETRRGPNLGRVVWEGTPEADTGIPEQVGLFSKQRVLKAGEPGVFHALVRIGDPVRAGQKIALVDQVPVLAPFDGMVRGLIQDGLPVYAGLKIGDIDPRMDPTLVQKVSDKALSVGGGVMEAILTWKDLRRKLAEG